MADVTISSLPLGTPSGTDSIPYSTGTETNRVAVQDLPVAYSSITGKPVIPAAQVNSDWNATSGIAQILNKPAISNSGINGAQFFTSSSTFTVPANTTKIKATVVGGGGGAGPNRSGCSLFTPGGPGGGGGVAVGYIDVTPGTVITVNIGSGGGVGGSGSNSSVVYGGVTITGTAGGPGGTPGSCNGSTGSSGSPGSGTGGSYSISATGFQPGLIFSNRGLGGPSTNVGGIGGCVLLEW